MRVLAIDPGPETSGYVLLDGGAVNESHSQCGNSTMISLIAYCSARGYPVLIEWFGNLGRHVGQSTFTTAWWIGRFHDSAAKPPEYMQRTEVLFELFNKRAVKGADVAVRQAMLDHFGDGTRKGAVGTKAKPGPCYGVSGHAWQALGLAVAWTQREQGREAA